ncbi:hypothetical protein NHJ6243_006266 [Beauveria neobassiana]
MAHRRRLRSRYLTRMKKTEVATQSVKGVTTPMHDMEPGSSLMDSG